MRQREVTFTVRQTVNDNREVQPDRYLVSLTDGDHIQDLTKESIEFASFQHALQAFINRIK